MLIGIDTGGTYTDAAIIAGDQCEVLASAKALTTKSDLAIGVGEAISAAIARLPGGFVPSEVSLVSVSTTLATNALVEGHGSAVGVVLVGFDARMAERTGIASGFPGMPIAMIAGGHDHNGDEVAALDVEDLAAALDRSDVMVEAYAVASAFAVRNPSHEHRARELIEARTGKPVTVSSELSSSLDAPRRGLTAVLNARLISRISLLVEAVQRVMAKLGIRCPLMVVKGDGTLALAERVAKRPIETVLSGPAASLVGARWLCGLDDFVMSDMGGTTTDTGILSNGRPKVSEEGAEVGGWRTMVKAIDIRTVGLGGDSEIGIGVDGSLKIGPARVVPISLIAMRFPDVLAMLDADLAESTGGSTHGRFILKPFGEGGRALPGGLTRREEEILALVEERPKPLRRIAAAAGTRELQSLRRKGLIQLSALTPSDAVHVLGLQDNWSREGAEKAVALAVRYRDMKAPTDERVQSFSKEVWSEVVRLSAWAVLDAAFGGPIPTGALVEAVCSGRGRVGLARVVLSPSVPVVAVGGPVKVYYPEVGSRLEAEVVFPPFCEVANAVGAATGVIANSVTVTIDGDGNGLFRVHSPEGTAGFSSAREAEKHAESAARAAARLAVLEMGGDEPEIHVSTERHMQPDAVDENGLLAAKITAEAISRPVAAS